MAVLGARSQGTNGAELDAESAADARVRIDNQGQFAKRDGIDWADAHTASAGDAAAVVHVDFGHAPSSATVFKCASAARRFATRCASP